MITPERLAEIRANDEAAIFPNVTTAAVDRRDLLAEMDRLREEAGRLAVTVIMYAHDAHPVYSNTTGWRGGIGGQAMTPGCSVINPPPTLDGVLWEMELPTAEARRVLNDYGIFYQRVSGELLDAWRSEAEKYTK